jgi:hypothetical protein
LTYSLFVICHKCPSIQSSEVRGKELDMMMKLLTQHGIDLEGTDMDAKIKELRA